MDVIKASLTFLQRTAVVANNSSYRYADVLGTALRLCSSLHPLPLSGDHDSPPTGASPHPRVALMCEPGAEYVAGTLATWLRRGIAVPLCLSHPDTELQYVLEDAGVSAVLATPAYAERMLRLAAPLGAEVHQVAAPPAPPSGCVTESRDDGTAGLRRDVKPLLKDIAPTDPALIVYTSGTTGRPKGALHTHGSVGAQVRALNAAWEWSPADRILHSLPLHHIHGIVNALYCPLAAGAAVEFMPKFSPKEAWTRLRRTTEPVSIFMGVPTMYSFLINAYDGMPSAEQRAAAAAAARLRLTVSGSAACPLPVMRRWEEVSGQRLLERYGMTETGMILGNPLHGERRPGYVGLPFPGVEVRLVLPAAEDVQQAKEHGHVEWDERDEGMRAPSPPRQRRSGHGKAAVGELAVRSGQLFSCYWGLPEASAAAFDPDGFFLTGDTAEVDASSGYYRLLGRTSVDVIKRGGYKISALHVESALLEHPGVGECAVVGLPDAEYGEQIAAVVAARQGATAPTLEALRLWAADRLPAYSLPTELRTMPALPRNAMGKVNKKALRAKLFPEAFRTAAPAA